MKRRVVTKLEQAQKHAKGLIDPLPPAGAERREELKKRTDALEAEAEILNADAGTMPAEGPDPGLTLNELAVSNPQTGFRYTWIWTGQTGMFIKLAQSRGLQLVQGEMQEAQEYKDVTGLRRYVDVVLMRCTDAQATRITQYYQQLANNHAASATSALKDLARRYSRHGILLHLTGEDIDLEHPAMQAAVRKAMIRKQAAQGVDSMVRNGTVPGMIAPGTATA